MRIETGTPKSSMKLDETPLDPSVSHLLPLEDYLHGILNVPSQLVRYAITSVTSGHYEVPQLVLRYLLSLDTGFRLLPLKNDSLRKRCDSIKYDVKKAEDIVYDLSILGANDQVTATSLESRPNVTVGITASGSQSGVSIHVSLDQSGTTFGHFAAPAVTNTANQSSSSSSAVSSGVSSPLLNGNCKKMMLVSQDPSRSSSGSPVLGSPPPPSTTTSTRSSTASTKMAVSSPPPVYVVFDNLTWQSRCTRCSSSRQRCRCGSNPSTGILNRPREERYDLASASVMSSAEESSTALVSALSKPDSKLHIVRDNGHQEPSSISRSRLRRPSPRPSPPPRPPCPPPTADTPEPLSPRYTPNLRRASLGFSPSPPPPPETSTTSSTAAAWSFRPPGTSRTESEVKPETSHHRHSTEPKQESPESPPPSGSTEQTSSTTETRTSGTSSSIATRPRSSRWYHYGMSFRNPRCDVQLPPETSEEDEQLHHEPPPPPCRECHPHERHHDLLMSSQRTITRRANDWFFDSTASSTTASSSSQTTLQLQPYVSIASINGSPALVARRRRTPGSMRWSPSTLRRGTEPLDSTSRFRNTHSPPPLLPFATPAGETQEEATEEANNDRAPSPPRLSPHVEETFPTPSPPPLMPMTVDQTPAEETSVEPSGSQPATATTTERHDEEGGSGSLMSGGLLVEGSSRRTPAATARSEEASGDPAPSSSSGSSGTTGVREQLRVFGLFGGEDSITMAPNDDLAARNNMFGEDDESLFAPEENNPFEEWAPRRSTADVAPRRRDVEDIRRDLEDLVEGESRSFLWGRRTPLLEETPTSNPPSDPRRQRMRHRLSMEEMEQEQEQMEQLLMRSLGGSQQQRRLKRLHSETAPPSSSSSSSTSLSEDMRQLRRTVSMFNNAADAGDPSEWETFTEGADGSNSSNEDQPSSSQRRETPISLRLPLWCRPPEAAADTDEEKARKWRRRRTLLELESERERRDSSLRRSVSRLVNEATTLRRSMSRLVSEAEAEAASRERRSSLPTPTSSATDSSARYETFVDGRLEERMAALRRENRELQESLSSLRASRESTADRALTSPTSRRLTERTRRIAMVVRAIARRRSAARAAQPSSTATATQPERQRHPAGDGRIEGLLARAMQRSPPDDSSRRRPPTTSASSSSHQSEKSVLQRYFEDSLTSGLISGSRQQSRDRMSSSSKAILEAFLTRPKKRWGELAAAESTPASSTAENEEEQERAPPRLSAETDEQSPSAEDVEPPRKRRRLVPASSSGEASSASNPAPEAALGSTLPPSQEEEPGDTNGDLEAPRTLASEPNRSGDVEVFQCEPSTSSGIRAEERLGSYPIHRIPVSFDSDEDDEELDEVSKPSQGGASSQQSEETQEEEQRREKETGPEQMDTSEGMEEAPPAESTPRASTPTSTAATAQAEATAITTQNLSCKSSSDFKGCSRRKPITTFTAKDFQIYTTRESRNSIWVFVRSIRNAV
ncbi:unnamed protein product [Cyprideis torosa]|uniref:Translin n=1 Tax=Cyprideis torosa TaxID=163714 RepID=A0A7R8W1W0_9CRUS|nr:unnamed protein product [Cyprideis torosa]CAG0881335.1 unnamed protein product [Cyprideis torosa]